MPTIRDGKQNSIWEPEVGASNSTFTTLFTWQPTAPPLHYQLICTTILCSQLPSQPDSRGIPTGHTLQFLSQRLVKSSSCFLYLFLAECTTFWNTKKRRKNRLETNDSVTVPVTIMHSFHSDCPHKIQEHLYRWTIHQQGMIILLGVLKCDGYRYFIRRKHALPERHTQDAVS